MLRTSFSQVVGCYKAVEGSCSYLHAGEMNLFKSQVLIIIIFLIIITITITIIITVLIIIITSLIFLDKSGYPTQPEKIILNQLSFKACWLNS